MSATAASESLRGFARAMFKPRPRQTPSDWLVENLVIPPPQTDEPGPFSLIGREYMTAPIDRWADVEASDTVLCFGSQTGKTTMLMAGLAWSIIHDPSSCLWVTSEGELAKSVSKKRWVPICEATPSISRLIPRGILRHKFATKEQAIGESDVYWIGSNSAGALSSRPVRRLVLDETDKFPEQIRREGDAGDLAEQRTKNMSLPQRWKASTPTIPEAYIWQEMTRGDIRRLFVPCPGCKKPVVFAWSKAFCSIPTGSDAWICWDKEARGPRGEWDLDRVEASAHALCPFCAYKIRDHEKPALIARGEWKATKQSVSASFASFHLSSLYACRPETTFGRLARKFLVKKRSLLGVQGFINGDLAEPYTCQDSIAERVEIICDRIQVVGEETRLLTADCQAREFWGVVRAWDWPRTQAIWAGRLDTWSDVEALQRRFSVQDGGVVLDSGFGARSEIEVYAECARHSEILPAAKGRGLAMGWMPAKGMPGRKRWLDPKTKAQNPYFLRSIDPFLGSSQAGLVDMTLFEFAGDFFKDILANLRAGKGGGTWTVLAEVATDEYWRHMDGEQKIAVFNKMTGNTVYKWVLRNKLWPNHLFDCEVMQLAVGAFLGFYSVDENG